MVTKGREDILTIRTLKLTEMVSKGVWKWKNHTINCPGIGTLLDQLFGPNYS